MDIARKTELAKEALAFLIDDDLNHEESIKALDEVMEFANDKAAAAMQRVAAPEVRAAARRVADARAKAAEALAAAQLAVAEAASLEADFHKAE